MAAPHRCASHTALSGERQAGPADPEGGGGPPAGVGVVEVGADGEVVGGVVVGGAVVVAGGGVVTGGGGGGGVVVRLRGGGAGFSVVGSAAVVGGGVELAGGATEVGTIGRSRPASVLIGLPDGQRNTAAMTATAAVAPPALTSSAGLRPGRSSAYSTSPSSAGSGGGRPG